MEQSRRMLVLRAVVEDYIRSQEPVGSSALTREHDLGVSSATIRNDMAALEDEGYLIQPHTSAGRVPTEKGYRFFVDRLATVMPLSAAQRRGIEGFLSGSANLTDTLRRAARLLSQITGQVAVVASPSLAKSRLRHVELVPVSSGTTLAVVITDTGSVAQHAIAMSPGAADRSLAVFTGEVNDECASLTLSQAAAQVRAKAGEPRFRELAQLGEALARAFESMADDERASELYMSGASNLAHQRDLADIGPLLDALEEQVVLMRLMNALSEQAPASGGVGVAIGSETHTPGLMHAAVVTSGYGRSADAKRSHDDKDGPDGTDGRPAETASAPAAAGRCAEPVAFVGSIGPTHMDYPATMAAVRAVARYLTAFLDSGRDAPGDGRDGGGR